MPNSDEIRATLEAYVEAYSTEDKQAFLDLFAPDAVWHDPVGADPHVGHEGIAEFWDATHSMADEIRLEVQRIVVCGEEALMVFSVVATAGGGGMGFDAAETFEFDGDGKLKLVKAYWDPADAREL